MLTSSKFSLLAETPCSSDAADSALRKLPRLVTCGSDDSGDGGDARDGGDAHGHLTQNRARLRARSEEFLDRANKDDRRGVR